MLLLRLGVAGNSAVINVKLVFAPVLAWAPAGPAIARCRCRGALLVVATVVCLGLRRR